MNECITCYPSLARDKIAVTLVAHGLNLKPEAMLPLINFLRNLGSEVYLVRLSGHEANGPGIGSIMSVTWQAEMLAGYEMAKQASRDSSLPLYFLGYSMGALLGQALMSLPLHRITFDRQVLLAPATGIRWRSYLLKVLFIFGSRRTIRSFAPEAYRANTALPLFVYRILFNEEKKVLASHFSNLNIPSLIVLDPKDELISHRKLQNQIKKYSLTRYRILLLHKKDAHKKRGYCHQIFDPDTLGNQRWKVMTTEIKQFLFGQLPDEMAPVQ
jgi:esterase/lipase